VALPVAGLVLGLVLVRTTTPTTEQQARWAIGQADLVVEAVPAGVDLPALLPDGARAVAVDAARSQVDLPGRRLTASLRALPLGDPLIEGMLQLDRGRAPAGTGEAAVSSSVLEAAGIEIGDTLHLAQPDVDLVVTGAVLEPQNVRGATVAVAPRALETLLGEGDESVDAIAAVAEGRRWLVELDGGDAEVLGDRLRAEHDLVASTRAELTQEPMGPAPVSSVFVLGALALFEAGLMAGAAFAVGARRQTRTLGLIAATGGERRHLAGVVLMSGVVLGVVGAGVGVGLGLAASLALAPSLDRITGTLIEGLVVPPLGVAGAAVLGVVAAVGAAWLPARSAARVPPADALAGQRPLSRPRRAATILGAGGVIGGCGLAAVGAMAGDAGSLLIVTGAVAIVAGFALTSPTLVGALGHLAPRLPTSLRLAVRDAARHRSRVGPAVAAVMAALSMPVAVVTLTASNEARSRANYVPLLADDQLLIGEAGAGHDPQVLREASEAMAATVPGTVVAPVLHAALPDTWERPLIERPPIERPPNTAGGGADIRPVIGSPGMAYVSFERPEGDILQDFLPLSVGSAELLEAAGGEEALAAFEAGKVVALGRGLVAGGEVELGTSSDNAQGITFLGEATRSLPAVEVDVPVSVSGPTFLISTDRATELGLAPLPAEQWLLRTPTPVDDETLDQLRVIADEAGAFVQNEEGFSTGNALLNALAVALSAVIALSVVAIATALSAAESRNDLATLTAIGAGPRIRRGVRATQAGVLAALGGVLAIPAGLLPAVTVLAARDTAGYLILPWGAMAAAAIAVPLVAAGAAALLSRTPRTTLTRRLA
jgi:putative ABC transport system permease protein